MTAARPRTSRRHRTGSRGHVGADTNTGRPTKRRCAVYTRKSSEEGLEQEYNSLHAQREACEAYICSQQHEGWLLVPTPFDDGGISGGTMDRPALQALLAEIRAGRIDIIVVYKVDRLTRSLADFAKMVELFDATGASFVAVTQQFNTTTSMGRLTLNVLLSFAQFEREVTGERIRDKIAASKRKGMWMGGRVPLGYAVQDRKLVLVPEDAATVVQLCERYLELGSVHALKAELDQQGVVSKQRTAASGVTTGGTPYSRGALYALLSNPVYIGQVRHRDECYPGQHQLIIPQALFDAVQNQLASSNNGERGRNRAVVEPSLLAGKLFDNAGVRLVPTHTRKGERRYRYYVSATLLRFRQAQLGAPSSSANPDRGWRLPARELEQAVASAMLDLRRDWARLATALLASGVADRDLPVALNRLTIDASMPAQHTTVVAALHLELIERVVLSTSGMTLTVRFDRTAIVQPDAERDAEEIATVEVFVPHRLIRRGTELRFVLEGGAEMQDQASDPALLKMLARAQCWFEQMLTGRFSSVPQLAAQLGLTRSYVQRLLPLALLAPALVEQVARGTQPPALTAETLQRIGTLPLRWDLQGASISSQN